MARQIAYSRHGHPDQGRIVVGQSADDAQFMGARRLQARGLAQHGIEGRSRRRPAPVRNDHGADTRRNTQGHFRQLQQAARVATMAWQRIASSKPPPRAMPFRAATTGFFIWSRWTSRREQSRAYWAEAVASPSKGTKRSMSAPAQNARVP